MAKKPEQAPLDYTPKPPQQVREQMAAADAIRAEMEAPPAPEQPQPEQPAQEPPPQEGTPPQQPSGEEPTWEQRARSLQGRYETLQRNYSQQGDRIGELERLINTMRAQGAEPPSAEPPPPKPKPRYVSPEEETEYGTDFLSVVGKRAKEEYAPEFDQLAERLKRLEGRVDGVGTVIEKTQVNDVYTGLNSQVPDWREINKHPDFHQWLDEPDLFSGRIRKDMLQEAFSRHEGRRVVSFFKGFLEAVGTPQRPEASEPTPPLNGGTPGKRSLEEFAAPGRARSAPQQLPPDKPVYTSAWIAKFTADKIAGKYRGREADADAIEQDIYRAQHEGRITQ